MLLTVIYAFKGWCLITEIRPWIARQLKFLHLYSHLAGPIQLLTKDGYKYVLNFIDYSGLIMLYFLKHKSNTLLTTMKYLMDITPYSHVKCLWTMRPSSPLNLFNIYLYLIGSNTSIQLLIFPHQNGTTEHS